MHECIDKTGLPLLLCVESLGRLDYIYGHEQSSKSNNNQQLLFLPSKSNNNQQLLFLPSKSAAINHFLSFHQSQQQSTAINSTFPFIGVNSNHQHLFFPTCPCPLFPVVPLFILTISLNLPSHKDVHRLQQSATFTADQAPGLRRGQRPGQRPGQRR